MDRIRGLVEAEMIQRLDESIKGCKYFHWNDEHEGKYLKK